MTLFDKEEITTLQDQINDLKDRIDKLEGRKIKADQTDKISFESFWNKYDKKVELPKCTKLWNNMSVTDQKLTLLHLDSYIPNTTKEFRKNPRTYLNNQCWNDEVICPEVENEKLTHYELQEKCIGKSPEGAKYIWSKYKSIKENGKTFFIKK